MSDYIKREDAISRMSDLMACDMSEYFTDIPSADVVEIVRCKDCIFNYANEHDCGYNPEDIVCTYWGSDGLDASDFCSHGKRMANNGAD